LGHLVHLDLEVSLLLEWIQLQVPQIEGAENPLVPEYCKKMDWVVEWLAKGAFL
jgi:hypothetical protein